jgi:hypothetical protein
MSLLRQPVTKEASPAAEPLRGRTPGGRNEEQRGRKEERQAAARKNTEPRQPDSRSDESFARHPADVPGYGQTALLRAPHHRCY